MKNNIRKVMAAVVLIAPWAVNAADDTTTMDVSATVVAACQVSATALNFGNLSTTQTTTGFNGETSISVTCPLDQAVSIAIDGGGSGDTSARQMTDGGIGTLSYNLYSDSARSNVWGDTEGTDTVSHTGTGSAVSLPVYGRIVQGTAAGAGTYTDTVTVSVLY